MSSFPCLVRFVSGSGQVRYRLGERLVDRYLEFVAGRCRPNTLRAVAFDLKAFFLVVRKSPVEVTAADVFEFLADQRGDRTVVRLADRESGLSARTIARRLSSVSGLYAYLVARGDTPVRASPVPRGLMTRRQGGTMRSRMAPLVRVPRTLPRILSPEQAGRRVGTLRTHRDRAMVLGMLLAGFVAAFNGSHRFVLDYLAEEVLERQSEQLRGFLLETSLLERLSGELCDAVTGRTDSQAMLEQVERANLFLVPLDEVRGWWRYHHLFADLLRARLQQEQPGRVPQLHRNAAAWCDDHGLADDAVRHALGAGDGAWAARLIERYFDAVFRPGERTTIERWLSTLPAELVRSRPRLLLAQTWMALVGGDLEGAGPPLAAAVGAVADAADEPFEPSVGTAASQLANIPAVIALARAFIAQLRGDAESTAVWAARAQAELGEGEWLLDAIARWQLAVAEWLLGRLEEAERGFVSVIARCRPVGERGIAAASCHLLGQVQLAQGRPDAALVTYQQTLEITAPPGRPAMPASGIAFVGRAEVAYQRNELDAAREYITEGIARCRQLNYTQPLAAGLAALAWIRQASDDPGGAREAMEEAGRAVPDPAVVSLFNPVPAERARLLLAQGDLAAAARWIQQRRLVPDDEPRYPWEREYLVLARVLLAEGRPGPARVLLDRIVAAAAARGRTRSVIETQALGALALAASGDEESAVGALAEALTLACLRGYVRVFVDEGAPMSVLLTRLVAAQRAEYGPARGVPLDCLARLQRAFGETDHLRPSRPAPVQSLVEQLTARELEVLALLAAGASNPRIAEELVVTVDTVKKHVSHLLGKLGAANRTEAVVRARRLGLIP